MGKLDQAILELEETILGLEKEAQADLKRTKQKLGGIQKTQTKVDDTKFYDLVVSFKYGDEEISLKSLGEMSMKEFFENIRNIPRTVFGRLKARTQGDTQRRGDKRRIQREFLKRETARRTKIFHAEERMRQLRSSLT